MGRRRRRRVLLGRARRLRLPGAGRGFLRRRRPLVSVPSRDGGQRAEAGAPPRVRARARSRRSPRRPAPAWRRPSSSATAGPTRSPCARRRTTAASSSRRIRSRSAPNAEATVVVTSLYVSVLQRPVHASVVLTAGETTLTVPIDCMLSAASVEGEGRLERPRRRHRPRRESGPPLDRESVGRRRLVRRDGPRAVAHRGVAGRPAVGPAARGARDAHRAARRGPREAALGHRNGGRGGFPRHGRFPGRRRDAPRDGRRTRGPADRGGRRRDARCRRPHAPSVRRLPERRRREERRALRGRPVADELRRGERRAGVASLQSRSAARPTARRSAATTSTLAAGETRRYRNVVGTLLGSEGAFTVEVRSTAPTLTATALVNNRPLPGHGGRAQRGALAARGTTPADRAVRLRDAPDDPGRGREAERPVLLGVGPRARRESPVEPAPPRDLGLRHEGPRRALRQERTSAS